MSSNYLIEIFKIEASVMKNLENFNKFYKKNVIKNTKKLMNFPEKHDKTFDTLKF